MAAGLILGPVPAAAQDMATANLPQSRAITSQPLWWTGNLESNFGRNDPRSESTVLRQPKAVGNGTYTYDAVFEEDLFLQTDLVLPGIHTAQTLTFPSPQLWQLLPGSEIRLQLDHSSALLADQSHLTVSVNDVRVASIALTAANVIDGELVVPLPVHALKDYNTLNLEVHQHYTRECEDPFSSSLWTKVSRQSSFHFVYKPRDITPDLGSYPLPLFDDQGYGPTVLNYVLPRSPAERTLEALGVVSAGLGRDVAYHSLALGMPVASVAESPGNTIVVGTPSENPEVANLVGNRVRDLSPGQGLVAMVKHPNRAGAAVLVVTGSDPAGVLVAAKALTTNRRHEVLSGTASVITGLVEGDAARDHEREHFVPNEDIFTLEQMGQNEVTVRGFFASPIVVPIRSLPDLAFIDGQQRLKVYYGYGAQLHTRLSTLEVRWNNITLKSIPLDDPEGEERAEAEIAIPAQVISPFNTLEFVFHLIPRSYEPCEPKVDKHLWGTIFEDTAFYMPRYHWAEMPDLGKLQYAMYPLGIYQDLSDTVLVTPDSPDNNDLMAAVAVASELGRGTVADRVALRTLRGDAVGATDRSSNHMVLLSSASKNSEVEALGSKRPLALNNSRKDLNKDDSLVLQAIDPSAHGTLEELISPYARDKAILIVQGLTPEYMLSAIRLFTDPGLASQLSGNVALLGVDRNIRTVQIGTEGAFGSVPMRVKARDWGRSNLWAVLLLLLMFMLLAYLVLSFLLGRYRQEHFDDDPEGGPGGGGSRTQGHDSSADYSDLRELDSEFDAAAPEAEAPEAQRPLRRPPPRRAPPGEGSDGGSGRSQQ